jgi:hypothetical protein
MYHMYDKNLLKVLKKATGTDGMMAIVVRGKAGMRDASNMLYVRHNE